MGAVIVQYQKEKKQFKELSSGQYYFDTDRTLCMKLNNREEEDDYGNCIFLTRGGCWDFAQEGLDNYVEPIQATLLIEGAG